MKKIILTLVCVFVCGAIGWLTCYFTYPEFSPEYIELSNELAEKYPEWKGYMITPKEFEKLQDDVAYMRKASLDESDELIFGVAYGTYKNMKYHHELGEAGAKRKSAHAINSFLKMYPDKNWGMHQMMADEIENWVVENPDDFNNIVEPEGVTGSGLKIQDWVESRR